MKSVDLIDNDSVAQSDITSQDLRAPSCDHCIARLTSMCSVLEEHEIRKLSEISSHLTKRPKQIIYSEGDSADYLYNIREGCVRISKMLADGRRQIIGFLFPGDFFGLDDQNGYSYSAEAITEIDLCRMPRKKILEKFVQIPKLGHKVLDITRSELQNTQDQMLLLGRKKAKEKLCSFVLAMAKKTSQIDNIPQSSVFLPMSRSDIADYLGLTIETVSRQFTILSKDGIISFDGNPNVTILNAKQMTLIAAGG